MRKVLVLVPVLHRPEHVSPLLGSLRASEGDVKIDELFICSEDDPGEIGALSQAKARYIYAPAPPGPGDYARKMNHGFRWGVDHDYEWVLLAADDVSFHPGWAEAALRVHTETNACVIATNDLGNPEVMAGRHATHPFVSAEYLECGTIDEGGKILHEGYTHQFVDNEFCQTAQWRGTWAAAQDSHVEHHHHAWGKAETDEVYQKGEAGYAEDSQLYHSRKHMWGR